MIVTLCGSMQFYPQILEVAADETARDNIVLAPFVVVGPEGQDSELKARLDILHRRKILLADHVIIVTDQFRYLGTSTQMELDFALAHGKTVETRARFVPDRVNPETGQIDTLEDYRDRAAGAIADPTLPTPRLRRVR